MFWADGGLNGDGFFGEEYGDQLEGYSPYSRGGRRPFIPNPLHYYRNVDVTIEAETEKAYLFKNSRGKYWIPKKLTRKRQGGWMQWNGFRQKYLSPETGLKLRGDY